MNLLTIFIHRLRGKYCESNFDSNIMTDSFLKDFFQTVPFTYSLVGAVQNNSIARVFNKFVSLLSGTFIKDFHSRKPFSN